MTGSTRADRRYVMRISRLTVDKLGVKLYDSVSAVVAELVANSYDADASKVRVRLPLGTLLAHGAPDGTFEQLGDWSIEVVDDGHGMTPDEAIDHYLHVGRNRRAHVEQGPVSRHRHRQVMGRKGIGKLAPFGICRTIEVISAGEPRTDRGFLVSHFKMDFDKIMADTDDAVEFDPGAMDRTYFEATGTTIRLSEFLNKSVPDAETFQRQLARRFALAQPDFDVTIEDTRNPGDNPPRPISPLDVPLLAGTRVDLAARPVQTAQGETLPVTGWLGLAKDAYKNEETTGVRIYSRGKLVGATRDFEQPAGYTGEFTMRSYLVGEVQAEWLDLDDGEDLVRTDRQSILWDSDYGQALRRWGADLIREIGATAREPRRNRVSAIFLETSRVVEKAKERYQDKDVIDAAVALATRIGRFAAEDELLDDDYVSGLTEIILGVAPHQALVEAFRRFSAELQGTTPSIDQLLDLFGRTRLAEMASYGQIVVERVRILRELEGIVLESAAESDLQELLARAPWLIEPTWSVISKNQALRTFKVGFEAFWKAKTGEEIALAIGLETKRPDFTLIDVGHQLHIVEIKAARHQFDDADCERMLNYADAFDEFFAAHPGLKIEFPLAYQIDVIADGENLSKPNNRRAYASLIEKKVVVRTTWHDFLTRAKIAHEAFLEASRVAQEATAALDTTGTQTSE
jgi:hypothetical protein